MITIKIRDLPEEEWSRAARLARVFMEDYPDTKIGIYHGCIFSNNLGPDLYIYKTKTQIIVRPTNNEPRK